MSYRGRFAPSPTGPLHFGSLFGACVSYLDAKHHHGSWLVRIEDIDPPREDPLATSKILSTLSAHGLETDEEISYQSQHSNRYEALLSDLKAQKLTYPCPCSRKDLEKGKHLERCIRGEVSNLPCAIKFQTDQNQTISWIDSLQGEQNHPLENDFVLKRKDGLYAYQLAVVADDIAQNISHVVRGIDLLESTPMQIAIYKAMNIKPPSYSHFPVITEVNGQKLSKQNLSRPVSNNEAVANLRWIANILGIPTPKNTSSCSELLSIMLESWSSSILRDSKTVLAPEPYQR